LLETADAIVISAAEHSNPKAPEGMVRGSAEGASAAMNQWADSRGVPDPLFTNPLPTLAVLIVTLPIVAAIGASRAHSAEEVDAAKQTFASVAADPGLLPTLERRIAARVREASRARWTCVGTRGAEAENPCPEAKAPATIEITASYAPRMENRYDPELSVAAMIEATLVPPSGPRHRMRWRYDSPPRPLFDLTANGGATLRTELSTMLDRLAEAVARDMIVDPQPITTEVWAGGMEFQFAGPEYRQANVPKDFSGGVARRMHPQEPAPYALDAALKATIVGWAGRNILGDWPCRIAKIDGNVAVPPLSNVALLPGQSPTAMAEPGEHVFTVACPGTGEDNWVPREIKATVQAGGLYCTDGKSFVDRTEFNSCR
jgi:hypothetical protein